MKDAGSRGGSAPRDDANYAVGDRDLKYYIFDWDDNILHMPTFIHLEKRTEDGRWVPHPVSTSTFSVLRRDTANYRPPDGDWEKAFAEFRDFEQDAESRFLRDTREAIRKMRAGDEKPAPSFLRFRQVLIEGRLFAIVTARGHNPQSIRQGVELFVENVLTPAEKRQMLRNLRGYLEVFEPGHGLHAAEDVRRYYLDCCRYHAVTSPHFRQLMASGGAPSDSSEERKQFAIRDFVEHVIRIGRRIGLQKPISVGFSDDDVGNVKAVESFVRRELAREFGGVKFVVYDTSDPEIPAGRKIVVQGQLTLAL